MHVFRSTLPNGASWHSWPDHNGRYAWGLPSATEPGDYRRAPEGQTQPHGNGLHGARWRALAYWFGPENYAMEIDRGAQQPDDAPLGDLSCDIVVARRARLVRAFNTTLEGWQDLSIHCAELLTGFPQYFNYEGRYDERANTERQGSSPIYPFWQNARLKYVWGEAVSGVRDFFSAVRCDPNYIPDRMGDNIVQLSGRFNEYAHSLVQHLRLIETQRHAHERSYGRCIEYNHHSLAMMHAMKAIAALGRWLDPWVTGNGVPTNDTSAQRADMGYVILDGMIKNMSQAYSAVGNEQSRLMRTNPSYYTMASGLGPLLQNLVWVPERALNDTSLGDLAARAVMLKMSEYFADLWGVQQEYRADMHDARTLSQ